LSAHPLSLADAAWAVAGIVWLIGSFSQKRTARRQTIASRLFHTALTVLAFLLLFNRNLAFGILGRRLLPDNAIVQWTGLIATAAGITLAIWARFMLGGNWSATVKLKQNHTLVRNGPYAIVRHPIYSGFLLAMLGTASITGEMKGLLAVLFAGIAWWLKLRLEEQFMIERFGSEYTRYQREVKALIPSVL
jgi:protein-S-isoprenylcysteine O-methyltransferase